MHFPRPPCPQLTIRTLTTLSVTIISPNSHLQRSWNWPSTVYGTRRWSTESFVRSLSLFLKRLRLLPRIHMNSTRFPERVTDSLTVTRDRYFWHLHDPCDLKCAPPHSCKWNIDVLSGSPNNPSIHTWPQCGVKTTFSRSTDLRMWYFHHLELSLK